MSPPRSLTQKTLLTSLLLVLGGGCGEPTVYTRGALDAGASADHPPIGEGGASPAGTGGAPSASGGMSGAPGTGGRGGAPGPAGSGGTGTGGSAAKGGSNGGGSPGGTGGTRVGSGGVVAASGGQSGTGAAGRVGNGGGTAASGSGGSTPGSGGQATGGTPGSGGVVATGGVPPGTGGSSSSGGAGGGFMCGSAAPVSPSKGIVSDFASITTSGGSWTASNGVTGSRFAYHDGSASTSTVELNATTHDLHCTASVGNASYAGCGIVIDTCLTAGANTALRFSISGTSTCLVGLQLQTYQQKPSTDTPAGGCAASCGNYPSSSALTLSPSPVTVTLSTLAGWTTASASQIVGVQWQMTNPAGRTSCTTDLRFDDITLVP